MKEKDEQLKILKNSFNLKKGLHFWCRATPVSKQSRNKIKKDLTEQILQARVKRIKLTSDRIKEFFNGDLGIELTFGLREKRLRKNDIDNLIKQSLDCLKGILFKDDSQIKEICGNKYSVNQKATECTGIRIYKIR